MQSATLQREDARNAEPLSPDMTRELAPLGVVAATFTDRKTANDAISDLRDAGFGYGAVALAFSTIHPRSSATPSLGEHSWLWKFRHRYEEDLHERGAEQMSGKNSEVPLHESDAEATPVNPSEIGLAQALEMFGTASPDRIAILNHEMGKDGALLLVNCDARAREVEAILEKNAGTIRTETVMSPLESEDSPSDSLPNPIR